MSLRIWNPFQELAKLENEIKSAFDHSISKTSGFFAPLTDLYENDEGFEIRMNVPGIKAEEFNIDATSDHIEIKAESVQETKEEEKTEKAETTEKSEFTPRHIERVSRKYYRKIHFSSPVDPNKANIKLQDGVLKISLPKKPEAKKVKLNIK